MSPVSLGIWLASGIAVGAVLMVVTGEGWWIGIGAGIGTVMGTNTIKEKCDED